MIDSKMKTSVALIVGSFPSKSETFIVRLANSLIENDIDVKILASTKQSASINEGINRYDLLSRTVSRGATPKSRRQRLLLVFSVLKRNISHMKRLLISLYMGLCDPHACTVSYLTLAESILKLEADRIVHAQFGGLGRIAARLRKAKVYPNPLIVTFRGGDSTTTMWKSPFLYKDVYEQAEMCFCNSSFLRSMHEHSGCDVSKLHIVRSGISMTEWTYKPTPRVSSDDEFRIIFVGRLIDGKGAEYAIEAANIMKGKYNKNVILQIYGDGDLYHELVRQAKESDANVRLYGFCPPDIIKQALYNSHAMFVPSTVTKEGLQESQSNAITEAMATGVVVICSRIGGLPERVIDGVSGFLVSEKSAAEMARVAIWLYEHERERVEISRNARMVLENDFDEVDISNYIAKMYKNISHSIRKFE